MIYLGMLGVTGYVMAAGYIIISFANGGGSWNAAQLAHETMRLYAGN